MKTGTMKSYPSIDGGGTKTAMLLTDVEGRTLSEITLDGCAYPLLVSGISRLLLLAGLDKNDIVSSS